MKTEIKERLQKLAENNPDFAPILEREFPEIIDNLPFVIPNFLFLREGYKASLYALRLKEHTNIFYIENLISGRSWSGKIEATGFSRGYYLSRNDFKRLLKQAGIKLGSIVGISPEALKKLHYSSFNRVTIRE